MCGRCVGSVQEAAVQEESFGYLHVTTQSPHIYFFLMVHRLHTAIRSGYVDLVVQLIAQGADVNGIEGFHFDLDDVVHALALLRIPMTPRMTPLCIAACLSDPVAATTIINALVSAGADLSAVCGMEKTPLHWAVFINNPAATVALLAAGAALVAKDSNGNPIGIGKEEGW